MSYTIEGTGKNMVVAYNGVKIPMQTYILMEVTLQRTEIALNCYFDDRFSRRGEKLEIIKDAIYLNGEKMPDISSWKFLKKEKEGDPGKLLIKICIDHEV